MSDRKYWIREMSWVEFDERRKETKTVIILQVLVKLRSSLTNGK